MAFWRICRHSSSSSSNSRSSRLLLNHCPVAAVVVAVIIVVVVVVIIIIIQLIIRVQRSNIIALLVSGTASSSTSSKERLEEAKVERPLQPVGRPHADDLLPEPDEEDEGAEGAHHHTAAVEAVGEEIFRLVELKGKAKDVVKGVVEEEHVDSVCGGGKEK